MLEAQKKSYADLLKTESAQPVELIDGAFVMQASPSSEHQQISAALMAQLYNYLEGKQCKVFAAPFDVRLFESKDDEPKDVDTVVVPDISVICDKNKIDEKGCKGAPDMIIEILSPSTQRQDRFAKLRLYQAAGVKEYWLVDPVSKVVQVMTLQDGRYELTEVGEAHDRLKVGCLTDYVIDLEKVFQD